MSKCVRAVKKAFPELKEEEITELANELQEAIRRERGKGIDETVIVNEWAEKLANRLEHIAAVERRNKAFNFLSEMKAFSYISNTWGDDLANGFEAMLVGVQSARVGARNSVASLQRGLIHKYTGAFISDLTRSGHHKILTSKQFERELFEISWKLDLEQDVSGYPKDVVETAKIMNKHTENMRKEANAAGADIGKLGGRLIKQTHDARKIKKATQKEWVEFIQTKIDWDKTMPDLPIDQQSRVLSELYLDFSTNTHVSSRAPVSTGLKGVGNIGKSLSHSRVLHFKDGSDAFDYHEKFGTGSISDVFMSSFLRMGESTALMKFFGPNAHTTIDNVYNRLLAKVKKDNPENAQKLMTDLKNKKIFADRAIIPNLDGSARQVQNHMAASVFAGVRFSQIASKLGLATVSGFTDIPLYGAELSYQGGSFMSGVGQAISGLARGIGKSRSADQLQVLSEINVMAQGLAENVSPRYDMADPAPGTIQKLTATFMKLNALQWWTDNLRTTFALASSHRLGLNMNTSHAGLNPELSRALGLFGINSNKWNTIRKGSMTEADGKMYLTTESVRNLDDSVISDYLADIGVESTNSQINRARNEMADELGMYYEDRAAHAVIEGDAKTKAWLMQGSKPGTPVGELLRTVMLFKSFPTAVLQKVVGRELYGRSETRSLVDALKNGNGEMTGLARVIVSTTIAGYIAMETKNLLKGKTPRDITDTDNLPKIALESMLQGGALGIYGDFLFGDMRSRYGQGPIPTAMGPIVGAGNDVLDVIGKAVYGGNVSTAALKVLKNNIPGGNLPFVQLAANHLIFHDWSEQLNPGYLRRMKKRLEKNAGQQMYLPTAKIIGN